MVKLPDHTLELARRHARALDSYHVWQRDTNDCGPHVVTMAINFWQGREVLDADDVARVMNRPRFGVGVIPLVIRRIPNWATFPWGIADMLRINGIPARWRFLVGEAALLHALNEGRVAMPIYGEPLRRQNGRWNGWSHVAILHGWDAVSQSYTFVDSSKQSAPTAIPRARFLKLWRNMGRLLVEIR